MKKIMHFIADTFKAENGIDLMQDKMALQRLKEAAEKAKIELSSSTQTSINLPFITADATGRPRVIANLKRERSGRQSSFLNRSSTLSGKGYGGV